MRRAQRYTCKRWLFEKTAYYEPRRDDGLPELSRFYLRYFFEWLTFNDNYDFSCIAVSLCTERIMRESKAIVVASSIHIFYMGIVITIIFIFGAGGRHMNHVKRLHNLQCTVKQHESGDVFGA